MNPVSNRNSSSSAAEHAFAPFIRILGKGKTGTRSLNQGEAQQAFGMILRGEVEPLQIGAFLMLLRVKEERRYATTGTAYCIKLDRSRATTRRQQSILFIFGAFLLPTRGAHAITIAAGTAVSGQHPEPHD